MDYTGHDESLYQMHGVAQVVSLYPGHDGSIIVSCNQAAYHVHLVITQIETRFRLLVGCIAALKATCCG